MAAGLQRDLLAERAAVGVGVHGDDAVAAQRGERRAEGGGHRGLADPALEAQHRDLVAAQQRLVDARGELAAADVGGALPRVEHPPGQHVDHAAPAALRRPLGVAEQPCGGEVGALGAARALGLLRGDGHRVRPVGVAHGGARGLRPGRLRGRLGRSGGERARGHADGRVRWGVRRYGSSRRRQPGPGQPCAGRARCRTVRRGGRGAWAPRPGRRRRGGAGPRGRRAAVVAAGHGSRTGSSSRGSRGGALRGPLPWNRGAARCPLGAGRGNAACPAPSPSRRRRGRGVGSRGRPSGGAGPRRRHGGRGGAGGPKPGRRPAEGAARAGSVTGSSAARGRAGSAGLGARGVRAVGGSRRRRGRGAGGRLLRTLEPRGSSRPASAGRLTGRLARPGPDRSERATAAGRGGVGGPGSTSPFRAASSSRPAPPRARRPPRGAAVLHALERVVGRGGPSGSIRVWSVSVASRRASGASGRCGRRVGRPTCRRCRPRGPTRRRERVGATAARRAARTVERRGPGARAPSPTAPARSGPRTRPGSRPAARLSLTGIDGSRAPFAAPRSRLHVPVVARGSRAQPTPA